MVNPVNVDEKKRGRNTNVARDAKKKGSGNSQQGGAASKANPTDFYGPGGMLPKAKLVRGA